MFDISEFDILSRDNKILEVEHLIFDTEIDLNIDHDKLRSQIVDVTKGLIKYNNMWSDMDPEEAATILYVDDNNKSVQNYDELIYWLATNGPECGLHRSNHFRGWIVLMLQKTPWNPSRKATKRVKNPLPPPSQCPHCSSKAIEVVNNSQIYNREYGDWPWVYLCTECRAYVGLHPYTNIPLGTLADKKTREARNFAKSRFIKFINTSQLTRSQAYQVLAYYMQIDHNKCHFGWFNVDQCSYAIIELDYLLSKHESILHFDYYTVD